MDHFHVVQWANEAVDTVRKKEWREAAKEVRQISKQLKKKRGRPKADDKTREEFNQAKQTADEIKSALYALGKAPENLTENQRHKVELIARTSKVLFRCYTSKEALRLILKMTDPQQASQELKSWYYRARHSRIDELKNLAAKIRRHEQNILNSITLKMSNARVEAVNNNIKLIIRKAYGFRNVENLKAMVLLCCSNLVIPLPNHAVSGKPAFLPGLKPRASCGKFCEEGLVQNKELQENLAELKANQAVPLPGEEEKAEKPEKDEKPEKAEKAEEPAKKDAAS